jgi:hypothetical protein
MNRVVDILCRRDGMTQKEAEELISIAITQMAEVAYNPEECEDIMMNVLGLEMDYIHDILM